MQAVFMQRLRYCKLNSGLCTSILMTLANIRFHENLFGSSRVAAFGQMVKNHIKISDY
jgi:hypothetical protein